MRRRSHFQCTPRSGRLVLAIAVAAVILGVAAFLVWGLGRVTAPRPNVARETADLFLSQIRSGDFKSAWESTTTDFKSDEGLASFTDHAKKRKFLKEPLEFLEMKEIQVFGLTRWECSYRPPSAAGTTVRVVIGNEQDKWRVEQLKIEGS